MYSLYWWIYGCRLCSAFFLNIIPLLVNVGDKFFFLFFLFATECWMIVDMGIPILIEYHVLCSAFFLDIVPLLVNVGDKSFFLFSTVSDDYKHGNAPS